MKLDLIHEIQTSYRKLVDAMSRPGLIADFSEEAGRLEREGGCLPATITIAMMLLDTEVTFKVLSGREDEATRLFNQLTYARAAEVEQADFIFVLLDAAPEALQSALELAKIGDLGNPHESATIVIETGAVSAERALRLTGPGIREVSYARTGARTDWVDIRAERNREYPLGLDLIFVDADHRIVCLPRTTQVAKEELG